MPKKLRSSQNSVIFGLIGIEAMKIEREVERPSGTLCSIPVSVLAA